MESLGIYTAAAESRCPFCGSFINIDLRNQLSTEINILWKAYGYCYTCNRQITVIGHDNVVERVEIDLGDRYAN